MIRIEGSVEEFNEWLLPVAAITDETRVFIRPEGIEIKVADPANVAMIHIDLPKKAFYEYEADEILTAGFDLCEINSMFENAEDGDMAMMRFLTTADGHRGDPEAKVPTLDVTIEGLTDSVSSLSPDSLRKPPNLPTMHFSAGFSMTQELLHRIMKKAHRVSDYLTVEMVNPDDKEVTLMFSAEGDRTRKFNADFQGSVSIMRYNMHCNRSAKAMHPLEYLEDLVGSIKKDRNIEVKFGTDYPISLGFEVLNGGRATFTLAPRVES